MQLSCHQLFAERRVPAAAHAVKNASRAVPMASRFLGFLDVGETVSCSSPAPPALRFPGRCDMFGGQSLLSYRRFKNRTLLSQPRSGLRQSVRRWRDNKLMLNIETKRLCESSSGDSSLVLS